MMVRLHTLVIALLGALLLAFPVLAQSNGDGLSESNPFSQLVNLATDGSEEGLSERAQQIAAWSARLDTLRTELDAGGASLDLLASMRDDALNVRDEVQVMVDELAPRLADERALLDGLVPEDGTLADTPEILAQQERIAQLESELQPAELLVGRANALRDEIVSLRAEEFTRGLFQRSSSLISLDLWRDGLAGMPRLANRVDSTAKSTWITLQSRATPAGLAGLAVLVVVLVAAAIPVRRLALRKAARSDDLDPSPFQKTLGALRIVLVSALIPAVGFALLLLALDTIGGVSFRAQAILESVALHTTLFFFISGSIRAFLAPGLAPWRLVPVADGHAGRAATFFRVAAVAYVIGEVLRDTAASFVSPLDVVQFLEAAPALITAFSVLAGIRAIVRGLIPPDQEATPPISYVLWRWTVPVAGLAALAVVVAQVLGFLALASFLVDRIVWSTVVLVSLHLCATLIEGVTSATFQEDTRTADWLHDNVGLSRSGLGQFGVLLSGGTKLVLLVAAASLIIAPFGVETGQLRDVFGRVFTGIEIGGFSFSLTSIVVALAFVFVGVVLTRAVQGWLDNRYLPKTSLDDGLKTSIRTGIGYIGVIVAGLVGLSYLGLNLENVALVAGALSVGIGFGLQSIVSNFVSGLILLAERPFKQGDWVVVGDEQGIVKRINVRATEIQTFDRATVLVPNQDFIAGTVKNRVHRDTLGRIDVPVGVGYDSDPDRVKEILLEIANAHPQTLTYPEPAVFFIEFGASSLDFMLFAYLADVGNGYGVRSDIRFEIFRRFKEEGIEIPFTQSDVTIRNLDKVAALLGNQTQSVAAESTETVQNAASEKGAGVTTVPYPDPEIEEQADPTPDDGPGGRS